MFETIRLGDQVTIFNSFLGERTGRAAIHNAAAGFWVLNIDEHPGIATAENVVKVVKGKITSRRRRKCGPPESAFELSGKAGRWGTTNSPAMTPESPQAHEAIRRYPRSRESVSRSSGSF